MCQPRPGPRCASHMRTALNVSAAARDDAQTYRDLLNRAPVGAQHAQNDGGWKQRADRASLQMPLDYRDARGRRCGDGGRASWKGHQRRDGGKEQCEQ